MSTEQLVVLLQQSLTNNARDGVTGMLLYGNETFLQALEGEEGVVDDLYKKIQNDPRHSNIQFLHRRTIQCRQYSDWSMGFKHVSDTELRNIEGLRDFSEKDFNAAYLMENGAVVETLMGHYREPYTPYWDPLVRELDEKEKVIQILKKALAHTRGCVEIASLVLESVTDANRKAGLSEGHVRLCELALNQLKQI
jgi:hypothetical protein